MAWTLRKLRDESKEAQTLYLKQGLSTPMRYRNIHIILPLATKRQSWLIESSPNSSYTLSQQEDGLQLVFPWHNFPNTSVQLSVLTKASGKWSMTGVK